MRALVGETIKVYEPNKAIIEYCKSHLVITNPDYVKKQRMGLWTGNTPKQYKLYEWNGEYLTLPFGTLREIKGLMDSIQVEDFKSTYVDYGKPIPLFDYQSAALEQLIKGKFGILKARAGSGKTQIGLALIQRYRRKALWITHTKDLLNQSKSRAEMYMDKSLMGTITEGQVNIGKGITFATVQTLSSIDLAKYRDEWDLIIVDECHRVAGSPTRVTQFSKVLNALRARHKYGLSATLHRADGLLETTYSLLGRIVAVIPDEAVSCRVMNVGIKPIKTGVGVSSDMLGTDGTLNYTRMIKSLVENPERNQLIINYLKESNQPTLVLSDRVSHLKTLQCYMGDIPSIVIDGKTKKSIRDKALEDMRCGNLQILFASYSLAKEGLDIPRLERLFMASPVKDETVVVQSVGRIARTSEGKTKPVCYDFVDDLRMTQKFFKQRLSIYKKNNCYLLGDKEDD